MRTDVKLGMVIALVTVLVAGGYYVNDHGADEPIEIKNGSMAENAKVGAGSGKAVPGSGSRSPKAAAARPSAKSAVNAKTRSKSQRGSFGKRNPNAKPSNGASANRSPAHAAHPNRAHNGKTAKAQPDRANRGKPAAFKKSVTKPGTKTERNKTVRNAPVRRSNSGSRAGARPAVPRGGSSDAGQVNHVNPNKRPGRSAGNTALTNAKKRGTLQAGKPSLANQHAARDAGHSKPNPKPVPRTRARGSLDGAKDQAAGRKIAVDTHRVQPGESLASLAKMYYGSEKHVRFLLDSNPRISDPRRLAVGVLVRIPPLPAGARTGAVLPKVVKRAAVKNVGGKSGTARTYTVRSGDTFYGIARDQLGEAKRWRELYQLNASLVGDDPSRLRIGQVLQLPRK